MRQTQDSVPSSLTTFEMFFSFVLPRTGLHAGTYTLASRPAYTDVPIMEHRFIRTTGSQLSTLP